MPPKRKTRSGTTPKKGATGSRPGQPRPRSPNELLTLRDLDGRRKRTYDIRDNDHNDKHGFLTLHFRSDTHKERYASQAASSGWQISNTVGSRKEEDSAEAEKGEASKREDAGESQGTEQPFQSVAYQETLKDLNLVDSTNGEAFHVPEESSQHPEGEVAQDKGKARAATPEYQQGISINQDPLSYLHGKEIVNSPSFTGHYQSSANQEVVRTEVEGHFGSAPQTLDAASESAHQSFLKEAAANPLFEVPASEVLESATEVLAGQIPVTDSEASQTQLESVAPLTRGLQEPLRLDTTQAFIQGERLELGDGQEGQRGVKRARSPEPPSLTSGDPSAPSAPSTPLSPRSRSNSRASPVRRRGSPKKPKVPSHYAPPQKIVTFNTRKFPPGWLLDPDTMAPVRDPTDVSNKIKDVIQNLYDVQSQTHGFVPETQGLLIDKMAELTQSLADLQRLTDRNISPSNPVQGIDLAPEIVDYVDDGRNPDIFTRDFVELVQRGNAVVNGKKQAFRDFSQVYAKALKEGIGGVEKGVDMVMENAGIEQDGDEKEHEKENGQKG